MAGHLCNASGLKISTRLRPCGLKIKALAPDLGTPDGKSPAITSTDWRKRAHAISSPGASTKRSKQHYDASDDISIHVDFEPDNSFSAPQYRFPRGVKAPWENVCSAPSWQLAASSTTASEDEPREVTTVQLKRVNPVVTNVNGEDIALPNRFSFDVEVVDPRNAPSGLALCELQRLNGPAPFRRLLSGESDDLFVKLQEMVNGTFTVASSKPQGPPDETKLRQKQDGSDSAVSCSSAVGIKSSHPPTEPLSDEEARFQRMLNRLQKKQPPSQPAQSEKTATVRPCQILDPAIVAMKVAVKKEAPETSTLIRPNKEAADVILAQKLNHMRNVGPQNSTDSGYSSIEQQPDPSARRTPQESSGEGQAKTLNPAAAEFKLETQNNDAPWLAPKKMSRQPLTNIFPEAMPGHPVLPHAPTPASMPSQNFQPKDAPAATAQHEKDQTIKEAPLPTSLPASQLTVHAMGSAESLSGKPVYNHPTDGQLPRPIPQSTFMATTVPAPALFPALGALPSAATLNGPVGVPSMSLPAANAFNTFPPTAGVSVPVFYQPGPAGLTPTLPATATLATPPQPLLGLSGKPARPYFPVTTKPRDHDPVKQQMYEAYLEWRKANEPGYHMKCKMRQANRVMRQCHQQQEKPVPSNPANWKMIAEKAKAAVGAAAAAAAAEKKRREESVKEEMKAKVKELSLDSQRALVGVKA